MTYFDPSPFTSEDIAQARMALALFTQLSSARLEANQAYDLADEDNATAEWARLNALEWHEEDAFQFIESYGLRLVSNQRHAQRTNQPWPVDEASLLEEIRIATAAYRLEWDRNDLPVAVTQP